MAYRICQAWFSALFVLWLICHLLPFQIIYISDNSFHYFSQSSILYICYSLVYIYFLKFLGGRYLSFSNFFLPGSFVSSRFHYWFIKEQCWTRSDIDIHLSYTDTKFYIDIHRRDIVTDILCRGTLFFN